ncbi:MAG: HNH endonuclease [Actinomycetota bacterium]|nr:HNH endonuclease [Actinomycetota bacterium]
MTDEEELAFREEAFAWVRAQQLRTPFFTRDDLSKFPFGGKTYRLIGSQTGIWRVAALSDSAIAISTAYVPDGKPRPYEDGEGPDGLQRYKWRGTDPNQSDNRALRRAMQRNLPLLWLVGIGYVPGTKTQLFYVRFPVYLVGEEPADHQFVVGLEAGQQAIGLEQSSEAFEIVKRYNQRVVKARYHQPIFRARVIQAYERKCAVCLLPFTELLEAAHIKPDSQGGSAMVSNGMSLCKIHHGAYDTNLMGISSSYKIHVRESVLSTVDGPTLQHSIKAMDGKSLQKLPSSKALKPDQDLLAERFAAFLAAS